MVASGLEPCPQKSALIVCVPDWLYGGRAARAGLPLRSSSNAAWLVTSDCLCSLTCGAGTTRKRSCTGLGSSFHESAYVPLWTAEEEETRRVARRPIPEADAAPRPSHRPSLDSPALFAAAAFVI